MPSLDRLDVAASTFKADPFSTYARLRAEAPVRRVTAPVFGETWLVTRYDDVSAVLKDPRLTKDSARVEYGDERDPVQRAQLIDISPLTHADRINVPLMVETGANDPRVPPSEADQIIAAVRAQGQPVWTILAANEGHGYDRQENRNYAFAAEVLFLRAFLLGGVDATRQASSCTPANGK